MLKNAEGMKPREIIIPEKQWKELMIITNEGIKRKLQSAKKLLDTDTEISAGLLPMQLRNSER